MARGRSPSASVERTEGIEPFARAGRGRALGGSLGRLIRSRGLRVRSQKGAPEPRAWYRRARRRRWQHDGSEFSRPTGLGALGGSVNLHGGGPPPADHQEELRDLSVGSFVDPGAKARPPHPGPLLESSDSPSCPSRSSPPSSEPLRPRRRPNGRGYAEGVGLGLASSCWACNAESWSMSAIISGLSLS
jgi:hypothetical protein